MRILCVAVLAPVLVMSASGCTKNYYPPAADSANTVIGAPTPVVVTHTIEFRALGTVSNADVSYGSAQEGTTTITTSVPWSASFKTTRTNLFVYVTGTAEASGALTVQIFIDGELFREADRVNLFPGDQVQASGTVVLSSTTLGLVNR